MGIEIEKHRAASYKDVDDSIRETYKSLLDQTKNTLVKLIKNVCLLRLKN